MGRLTAGLALILSIEGSLMADAGQRQPPVKAHFTTEQIAASQKIKHLIVIYQENWSFDSLYGKFPGVNGIASASPVSMQQIDRKGKVFDKLPQCINTNTHRPYTQIPADLPNGPFDLLPYIPIKETTGDLVHRYYQEIAQINGGLMNAFAAWSNAGGFVMSYYDISSTRMGKLSSQFTICDNFFHSCYGGSMCNVIWLFSSQMPVWKGAPGNLIAQIGPDGKLIQDGKVSPDGYVINDIQPFYPPYKAGTAAVQRMPPQTFKTVGDLLSEKGVSWGWYAEGWDQAVSGAPPGQFSFHHQAPSYFKQFAPGTKAREEHLLDLNKFYAQLESGMLPAVSFIRSLNTNSEHPSDGGLLTGLDWCADLIEKIQKSSVWKDCAIIVTYDENGGRWDHVSPPTVDQFGPATRIPAAVISPYAKKRHVDHTCYETVSILKFIEERWGLSPLSSRDAQANNLLNAFDFEQTQNQ